MKLSTTLIIGIMTYNACVGDKQGMAISGVFLFITIVIIQSILDLARQPPPE